MEENKYLDITCKIMNAAMKGESLDLSAYDNDPEFLRIMKEQTFLPFLYEVDKRKIWRKYYYQAYLINEKFDAIGKKIKEIFDANNIDHIFLKGYELRKLYPKPWLRQMGDIDVLVREENYEKALKVLNENRFTFDHQIEYHTEFKYENYSVEVHKKLSKDDTEYNCYFKKPFNYALQFNNSTYEFEKQYNFLYLLCHYIKHLKNGAGLRELCDFYALIDKNLYETQYIKQVLVSENCDNFFDTLLNELYFIFHLNKMSFKKNDYIYDLLLYSLKSGIHGFGKNNNRAQNEFIKSKQNKFVYLLKKIFIPVEELFKKYKWTKSIILIPLGYVVRLFHLIFTKKKELKQVISTNEENILLKKIGIN